MRAPNISAAVNPSATFLALEAEQELPTEGQGIPEFSGVNNLPLLPPAPPLATQVPHETQQLLLSLQTQCPPPQLIPKGVLRILQSPDVDCSAILVHNVHAPQPLTTTRPFRFRLPPPLPLPPF